MSKPRPSAIVLVTSFVFIFGLSLIASSAAAQGLASVALPKSGPDPVAVYHAKVREAVESVLHDLTESLSRRDSIAARDLYTGNARSVMGDQPEAVTASAIVKQLFKTPLAGAQFTVTVDDFDMSSELAFVSAVVVARVNETDIAPQYIRSLFVFRFDDWHDRWQIREQFVDYRVAGRH
jgi:hypothetical protein